MKIGYSVEGSTDRGVLQGLRDRWCPEAELLEGTFRGTSGQSQRREIPKTCIELCSKGIDLIVFLRDANKEPWRGVLRDDAARCRPEHRHLAVFGVCDRNIECWLCADADWIAQQTDGAPDAFRAGDPKAAFESAMGITGHDKKEDDIAALVKHAPLHRWLANRSWEDFYDKLRQESRQRSCTIENLRESA